MLSTVFLFLLFTIINSDESVKKNRKSRNFRKFLKESNRTNVEPTNLLFIMFDDLRPELSIYGKSHMITPNFERLAKRSVIFDQAHAQVAVCNPSRNSLLTGLRPDSMNCYGFQNGYENHMIIPTRLKALGYHTSGYGKIRHWEGADSSIWDDHYSGDWYQYQDRERDTMNSTVMPDIYKKEETFPDYIFTTKAIETLKKNIQNKDKLFMLAIGYKMPHLAYHVPYKYYQMYRSRSKYAWLSPDEDRKYPNTSPLQQYRCCADSSYRYMNEEGKLQSKKSFYLFDLVNKNESFPQQIYTELMWGYSAAISFVDTQIGRIFDVLDELNLWGNMTVVLTSDHGMHNGEKGLWEKWTLFDESTRVPLLIAHPDSPHRGRHFTSPVELIDLFPTINDLLGTSKRRDVLKKVYEKTGSKWTPLQGKSLAPYVLRPNAWPLKDSGLFALSQTFKCTMKFQPAVHDPRPVRGEVRGLWTDCSINMKDFKDKTELPLMGYSMRTSDFRYTAWLKMNRTKVLQPNWDMEVPVEEELYDHRDAAWGSLGHRETTNLARDPLLQTELLALRRKLIDFLKKEVKYRKRDRL